MKKKVSPKAKGVRLKETDVENWACCDRCNKWRRVFTAPFGKFYCTSAGRSCDEPEDSYDSEKNQVVFQKITKIASASSTSTPKRKQQKHLKTINIDTNTGSMTAKLNGRRTINTSSTATPALKAAARKIKIESSPTSESAYETCFGTQKVYGGLDSELSESDSSDVEQGGVCRWRERRKVLSLEECVKKDVEASAMFLQEAQAFEKRAKRKKRGSLDTWETLKMSTHIEHFDLPFNVAPSYGDRKASLSRKKFRCCKGGLLIRKGELRLGYTEAKECGLPSVWLRGIFLAERATAGDFLFRFDGVEVSRERVRKYNVEADKQAKEQQQQQQQQTNGMNTTSSVNKKSASKSKSKACHTNSKPSSKSKKFNARLASKASKSSSRKSKNSTQEQHADGASPENKRNLKTTHVLLVGKTYIDASDTEKFPNGLLNTNPGGPNSCCWASSLAHIDQWQSNAPYRSARNVFVSMKNCPAGTMLTSSYGKNNYCTTGFAKLQLVPTNTEWSNMTRGSFRASRIRKGDPLFFSGNKKKKKRRKKKKVTKKEEQLLSDAQIARQLQYGMRSRRGSGMDRSSSSAK